MAKNVEENTTRYTTVGDRKVNHEGRIGYTWRFFPEEAAALDARIAKDGYTDRTSWFREVVLKLPKLERKAAAPKKPAKAKKSKKAAKGGEAPAKPVRRSKADIGAPADAAPAGGDAPAQ